MDTDPIISQLARVSRVEPPQFLYTRIQARLQEDAKPSTLFAWTTSLAMALLLIANSWVWAGSGRMLGTDPIEQLSDPFFPIDNNQLYHD